MSNITIQEVTVEFVKKGKTGYNVANVVYDDDGKNYTKKIISFANPAVFDAVKNAKVGETYEVKVVKEGKYYNWAALTPVNNARAANAEVKPGSGKVVGSNYETAEERKLKQLYIIKQSSIANAIEFFKHPKFANSDITSEDILDMAQDYVDFVYGVNENLEKVDADIPY